MRATPHAKKVWYLRRTNLFASMADEEIATIAPLLNDHFVPAGTELLGNREHGEMFLVKEGAVRLSAGDPTHQVTLALLGPGRLFGLSGTVGDDSPVVGATVLEPSYICFITWARLLEVFTTYPAVLMQIMRTMAEQVFLAERWVGRLRMTQPRARLAHLLLELDDEFGEPVAEGAGRRIRFRLTQEDLGRMIGVSRETISRLMAEFGARGWVVRVQGRLILRDRPALIAISAAREEGLHG